MNKTDPYTAGEFRHLVQIQRETSTDDGAGGQDIVWANHVEAWCSVTNTSGSEPYGDGTTGRVRTFQGMKFVTWWRDDILPTDRVLFSGTLYNIRQVNNVKLRNKFLEIVAESGVEQ